MLEDEDYVYFFLREQAVEYINWGKVKDLMLLIKIEVDVIDVLLQIRSLDLLFLCLILSALLCCLFFLYMLVCLFGTLLYDPVWLADWAFDFWSDWRAHNSETQLWQSQKDFSINPVSPFQHNTIVYNALQWGQKWLYFFPMWCFTLGLECFWHIFSF